MNQTELTYAKVPPQLVEVEAIILGTILLEKSAFDKVSELLKPECFHLEAHEKIFTAMIEMVSQYLPVDIVTISDYLRKKGILEQVGGISKISQLTNNIVSSANIVTHCRLVLEKYIRRRLINISSELLTRSYSDIYDVFDLLDWSESNIISLGDNFIKSEYTKLGEGMGDLINQIEYLKTQDQSLIGITTGFKEMDKIIHGWQKTDLVILAARPSVGKTAFALNLTRNAAISQMKNKVGFFSLEMSKEQLLRRVVSMDSNIELRYLTNGRVPEIQLLHKSWERIDPLEIYVDDTAALSIMELRSKARRMVAKNNVELIIIDYLQLMTGDNHKNGNREQEISSISRGLKKLAKELKIPIIALSQLSREIEKRGKGQKVPQLSDIRESGAIEQDADIVMFLYRPAEDEIAEDASLRNVAMVKIAKNRNGSLESFVFQVDHSVQQWTEKGLLGSDLTNPPTFTNSGSYKRFYEVDRDDDNF